MRKAFFRWLVEFLFNTVLGVLLVIIVLLLAIVVEYVISNISSVFPPAEYLMSAFTWVMGLVIFFLMSVPSAIMFLWAAFDGRKQGLHDKVCRTLVVRTAAASPEGNAVMERLPPEPAAPPPDPLDTRENPPI